MLSLDTAKYQALHNEFISLFVEYHNWNTDFNKRVTIEKTKNLKRILRTLRRLEKEMHDTVWDIYLATKKGEKEAKRHKAELLALRKTKKPPLSIPRKDKKNDNNSTTT